MTEKTPSGIASVAGRVLYVLVVTAVSISTIMSFSGVVYRYVLEIEAWWVFPIQQYTYIALVFLGAAVAAREGIHVRVEMLDVLLAKRPRAKHVLDVATRVIAVVASIAFTYLSFGFMIRMWQTPQYDVVLQWFNLGWVKSLPFVTGLLFCGYFGGALLRSIRNYQSLSGEEGERL